MNYYNDDMKTYYNNEMRIYYKNENIIDKKPKNNKSFEELAIFAYDVIKEKNLVIKELEQKIDIYTYNIIRLQNENNQLEDEIDRSKNKNNRLEDEIIGLENQIIQLNSSFNEIKSNNQNLILDSLINKSIKIKLVDMEIYLPLSVINRSEFLSNLYNLEKDVEEIYLPTKFSFEELKILSDFLVNPKKEHYSQHIINFLGFV